MKLNGYVFEVTEYGERYVKTVAKRAATEAQAFALVSQDYPAAVLIDRVF